MSATRRVRCLSGSLRQMSANTAALLAARHLAPPDLELVLYEQLGALPLFNPDVEGEALPDVVRDLRLEVGCSDALLIACPEYAHGVPGAFKNLLDWLVGSLKFPGKAVLLLNTSGRGSHHAQDALCEIMRTMSACLLSTDPLGVSLPGAGCSQAQVLASPERCRELHAALACLSAGLDGLSAARSI